jgi:hypothetical protein
MLTNLVSTSQDTRCMWKRRKIGYKSNASISIKTDWLMRFRIAVAVYSDNLTKHRKAAGSYNNHSA